MLYQTLTSWGRVRPQEGGGTAPKARWPDCLPGRDPCRDILGGAGPKHEEWLMGVARGAEHRPAWECTTLLQLLGTMTSVLSEDNNSQLRVLEDFQSRVPAKTQSSRGGP